MKCSEVQFSVFQEGPGVDCEAFDAVEAAVEAFFLCNREIF